jgi:hypothetical protein
MLERTPRYDVLVDGKLFAQLYFNMKGYVGTLPLPDGSRLDIGERSITEYRKEVAKLNRESTTPAKSESAIANNIQLTILRMKRQGTIGASIDCLRQNTPTKGVDVHPGQYNAMFADIATKVAKQLSFELYISNNYEDIPE